MRPGLYTWGTHVIFVFRFSLFKVSEKFFITRAKSSTYLIIGLSCIVIGGVFLEVHRIYKPD